MFKIVKAEQLSATVYMKVVEAPRVAQACEPGQFIIVRLDETAERIPLTICDYDREAGTVTIVFQPIGVSTSKMVDLKEGDYFLDFVGPLGKPSELVTDDFEEVRRKRWFSSPAAWEQLLYIRRQNGFTIMASNVTLLWERVPRIC